MWEKSTEEQSRVTSPFLAWMTQWTERTEWRRRSMSKEEYFSVLKILLEVHTSVRDVFEQWDTGNVQWISRLPSMRDSDYINTYKNHCLSYLVISSTGHFQCVPLTMGNPCWGFPGGSDGKDCLQWRPGFNPWVGKIPWRRKWLPTAISLPGKSHGQRSLTGYSPWGCKELETTERLTTQHVTCEIMRVESSINTGLKIQTYILKKKRIQERRAGRWCGGEGMLRGKGIQKELTQKPRDKAFKTRAVPNVYFSRFPQQPERESRKGLSDVLNLG